MKIFFTVINAWTKCLELVIKCNRIQRRGMYVPRCSRCPFPQLVYIRYFTNQTILTNSTLTLDSKSWFYWQFHYHSQSQMEAGGLKTVARRQQIGTVSVKNPFDIIISSTFGSVFNQNSFSLQQISFKECGR